ncbi:hypothetical protein PCL1606_41550 [Pseudomonas chlororaphis]|uniref:Uncharacterized protein n=1 Tax=Pseudomonas chlororaphis TaxID=587753 RepID=A0A0D5Y3Q4_9PSED|nr:hypothetical protein PCL1606_41550 [Pseudomonas chlororaphis]
MAINERTTHRPPGFQSSAFLEERSRGTVCAVPPLLFSSPLALTIEVKRA